MCWKLILDALKPKPKPPDNGSSVSTEVTYHTPGPEPLPPKARYPLFVFIPELMVAEGNLNEFCRAFRAAGGHGIRFFLLQSWSDPLLLPWLPMLHEGEPVNIVEDGNRYPLADFDRTNPDYWTRLSAVLAIIKANDLSVIASLGDNCSFNTHAQFFRYPFVSAKQTMSPELFPMIEPQSALREIPGSAGGLYGPDKYPLFRSWVKACADALDASGIEYKLEIQNEFSRFDWPPSASEPRDWYAMIVDAVLGRAGLVHSGDMPVTLQFPGVYAMHQIERAGMFPFPGDFSRLMLSGDGGYAGPFAGRSETDIDCEGRRGLSVEDAVELAQMIQGQGIMGGYEWMPKRMWRYSDYRANVDDIPMDIPAAMTAEWAK